MMMCQTHEWFLERTQGRREAGVSPRRYKNYKISRQQVGDGMNDSNHGPRLPSEHDALARTTDRLTPAPYSARPPGPACQKRRYFMTDRTHEYCHCAACQTPDACEREPSLCDAAALLGRSLTVALLGSATTLER